MGPNAMGGQDFGWKLAEEVLVELKRIKRNGNTLQGIANNMGKAVNEINDTDILKHISDRTDVDDAPVAMDDDYSDEYEENVKRLEREGSKVDTRLEDARIEAEELGIDVTNYGENLNLIKARIAKEKRRIQSLQV
jgi:hypothetical protein